MKAQAEEQYAAIERCYRVGTLEWGTLWFQTNTHISTLSRKQQKMVDWWRKVLRSEGGPIGEKKRGPKINPRIPRFQLPECCRPPEVPLQQLLKRHQEAISTSQEGVKEDVGSGPLKLVASTSTGAPKDGTDTGKPQAVVLAVVSSQLQEKPEESEPMNIDLGETDSDVSLAGTNLEQLLGTAARIQEEAPGNSGSKKDPE